MKYYIIINEKTAGPYTLNQVKALYTNGVVESTFLYATKESKDWLPISMLVPLFDVDVNVTEEKDEGNKVVGGQPTIVINNMSNNVNDIGYVEGNSNFRFRKSRTLYQVLAIFLGAFGVHNFYARRNNQGWSQLLITVLTCGYGGIISHIWAIVEIIRIKVDGNNVMMD